MRRTLINTKSTPRKVVVHPKRGYLFWTEYDNKIDAIIFRSNLDGTAAQALFQYPKLIRPTAITIDYEEDIVYWFDSEVGYLTCSDLNGQNVRINLKQTFGYRQSQSTGASYYGTERTGTFISIKKG